jgi:TatD DNase family protein
MIDSHCHLDFKEFDGQLDETIKAAGEKGVHTVINIGCDLESSYKSVELSVKYENVYAAVGVHPHDAKKFDHETEEELYKLLDNKKVVAIGETGLDFYRDLSPRKKQTEVFRRHLDMAVKVAMPVVIHSRQSFPETVEIIREYSDELAGGVFHCFPGTVDDAYEVIDLGFSISVGGVITYKNSKMGQVAAEIPLEYILLETDSPYLTPEPFRGKTNQPAYVKYVAQKLSELKSIPFAEVEKITDRNTRKVFRIGDIFEG